MNFLIGYNLLHHNLDVMYIEKKMYVIMFYLHC